MRIAARRWAIAGGVHALLAASVGCSLLESFDGYTDGGTFDAREGDSGFLGGGDGPADTSRPDVIFIPIKDTGPRDTSAKQDSTTGKDSAPMTCPDNTTFTPIPWSPPTMFFQGACTPAETAEYVTTLNSPNTSTSGSASCDACIQSDYGDLEHGPIITAVINGVVTPIEINYGGCLANLDGSKGPGSCGNLFNDANDCGNQECDDCAGGPTQACVNAIENGVCAAYVPSAGCNSEGQGATFVQVCLGPLQTLLDQWCGPPPDSGAPPEAGGGDGATGQ